MYPVRRTGEQDFASVTEDAASQEDWREGFASMTEGVANQEDWSAIVVADGTRDRVTSSVGDRGTSRCWRMEYLPR
jgi:hypothetical protein